MFTWSTSNRFVSKKQTYLLSHKCIKKWIVPVLFFIHLIHTCRLNNFLQMAGLRQVNIKRVAFRPPGTLLYERFITQ